MTVAKKTRFMKRFNQDIVRRWEGNPLIDIGHLEFRCADIHNAGAVCVDGQILLLITIEHLSGLRCIHLARPDANGYYHVDRSPLLCPSSESRFHQHESHGVMDARVTELDGTNYIVYNAIGEHGYRVGLARTEDFSSVERLGLISQPDTKAAALFPTKINGKYARLERPCSGDSIWITYSDDLLHWGGSELVITPRGGFWDSDRVGVGTPPIEVRLGWLVIYYGVKHTSAGPIYRAGTVILDRNKPSHVVARANVPILSPRENDERIGDVPNLVFPTGAVLSGDGCLDIYYGASNSCICVGSTTVEEIITNCLESEQEY